METTKTDNMKCGICGTLFDQSNLTSVFFHEHREDLNPAYVIGIRGMELKSKIIKNRYPLYNKDVAQSDIEINSDGAKELMNDYLIQFINDELPNLLAEFWQRTSDACPLECTAAENEEENWRNFIHLKYQTN